MQIENTGRNELTISGNIKSIEDSMEIKKAVGELQKKGGDSLVLKIPDSFAMTSTVIGFLMKLINVDKIAVSLVVNDRRLFKLLEELSLLQLFNVRHAVR